MKRIVLHTLLLLLGTSLCASTGGEKDEKIKGKHRRIAEEAEFFYSIEDHFMSCKIYSDLVELYPENIEFNFRLGFSYLHMRNEEKMAIPYLEMAANNDYTPALYFLAEAYHLDEQFHRALLALDEYRKKPDHRLTHARIDLAEERVNTAMGMMANPLDVNIKRLSTNVNSDFQDYAPNIDAEGNFLYFTSRRPESTGGFTDQEGNFFEDIFVSKYIEGSWTKAEPLPRPINGDGHDANVNFAASGNSMIIYRTHKNLYSGDLYISKRVREGWSEPEIMETSINTNEYHEPSASYSPDENEVYVVSDRPGGFGGKDIYVIRRLPNGEWSEPQNLGRDINSAFDEDAPFVSLDGQNLFYSSMGNGSIGGYDVFRSKKNDLGEWSAPTQLGYPINSVYDDIYFSVTADGKRGFLSSSRERTMDIFELDMLYELDDLVVIKGGVTDKETQEPIGGTIHFTKYEKNEEFVSVVVNNLTGKYVAAVLPEQMYTMTVSSDGYKDYTSTVQVGVNAKGEFEVLVNDIELQKE